MREPEAVLTGAGLLGASVPDTAAEHRSSKPADNAGRRPNPHDAGVKPLSEPTTNPRDATPQVRESRAPAGPVATPPANRSGSGWNRSESDR